jgi:hypothetical protein
VVSETDGSRHLLEAQGEVTASGVQALIVDATGVTPASASTYRLVVGSAPVAVDPGDSLAFSAVARATLGNHGAPSVGVLFYDLASQEIADTPGRVEVTSDSMTTVAVPVVTAPASANSARAVFVLPNDAILYVDDVCLVR